MDSKSLLIKYRPERWEAVVGQDTVVRSLRAAIQRRASHAFLFVGASGLGKTTLARLAAKELGCSDLTEENCSKRTGIDDMRDITSGINYRPLGSDPAKGIILDECFAKGTLVDTPIVQRRIEDLKVGDKVFGAKGVQTVASISRRLVPLSRILHLRLERNLDIIVSQEHPFLTCGGWIVAEKLYAKRLPFSASYVSACLSHVWDDVHKQGSRLTVLSKVLIEEMCNLWRRVRGAAGLSPANLFSGVWEQTWGIKAGRGSVSRVEGQYSKRAGVKSSFESRIMGIYREATQPTYVAQQPNERSINNRQDDSDKGDQWYSSYLERGEGRQWQGTDASAGITALTYWWAIGVCGYLWAWTRAKGMATLLQSGYWTPSVSGGGRNRWDWACRATTSERQDQRSTTAVIGVDHPSLQELSSFGLSPCGSSEGEALFEFYDLGIIEHPSFSVAGVVVHNCHFLSKNAWSSLLKPVEEPPSWVYWFFCTTESGKVPAAIKTRSLAYELKPVSFTVIQGLLNIVAKADRISVSTDILGLCAKEAGGSPRQALANLAVCSNARTREEAAELLLTVGEAPEAIDFVRALYQGAKWGELQSLLCGLVDMNAESIRQVVRAYGTKVVLGAKSEEQAGRALEVLDVFSEPCYGSDGITPILLAVARLTLMDHK